MLPTEVAILLDPSLSQFRGFLIITDHHAGPFASAVRRKLTSGGQTKIVKARTITRTRVTELAELHDVEGQLDRQFSRGRPDRRPQLCPRLQTGAKLRRRLGFSGKSCSCGTKRTRTARWKTLVHLFLILSTFCGHLIGIFEHITREHETLSERTKGIQPHTSSTQNPTAHQ